MPPKRKMPVESKGTPKAISLGDEEEKQDFRQMCKYGMECYQKNPMHHQKFRHPKEAVKVDEPVDGLKEDAKEDLVEEVVKEVEEPAAKKAKIEVDDAPLKVLEPEANPEKTDDKPVEDDSDEIPAFENWPKDPVNSVEQKFLTKVPEDFMAFWDFCKGVNRENPREALNQCGLKLVGPFDIVAGEEFTSTKLNDYLCHYRYYRDPPEFQTVIVSTDEASNFHIGYFRDDPNEVPVFVAALGGPKDTPEYDSNKFVLMGDNLFATIYLHIGQMFNKVDPFRMTSLQKLKEKVHVHASMKNQDQSFSLEAKTTSMKCRDKKKVAATFHGAGLVVPYNKETQVGYREIPETNANLKKMFDKILEADKSGDEAAKNKSFDDLQELITNVQFANDEGDPGQGLELGIDLLVHGGNCFNSTIRHLLTVAYGLVRRDAFAKIANAHLNRRKESVACFRAQ